MNEALKWPDVLKWDGKQPDGWNIERIILATYGFLTYILVSECGSCTYYYNWIPLNAVTEYNNDYRELNTFYKKHTFLWMTFYTKESKWVDLKRLPQYFDDYDEAIEFAKNKGFKITYLKD